MQKSVIILFSLIIFNSVLSQTLSNKNINLIGYLDNDNVIDTLVYSKNKDFIVGKILTSNLKITFKYYLDSEIDTNIDLPKKGCIAFVTSGVGVSRNEEIQIYNFDSKLKNWILTKSISFSHNIDYGIEVPSIEFSYFENETETINEKKIKYNLVKPKEENIIKLVNDSKNGKYNRYEIIEYIFNFNISTNNLTQYNNLAYYLQNDELSLYILQKLIKKFPNRVVAYLNFADSYFKLGNNSKAIENYKKYIQLMTEQKKDLKKIPKYVYERVK